MKTKYLGIKVVEAVEMTAEEAKKLGYKTGDPENIKGFEVTYQDGYKSWCPWSVFVKNNYDMNKESIAETIPMMFVKGNDLYNLLAEYQQLNLRIQDLDKKLLDYEAGKIQLTPLHTSEILMKQLAFMTCYLNCLKERLKYMGVNYPEDRFNELKIIL